jgi:hypothetical protein
MLSAVVLSIARDSTCTGHTSTFCVEAKATALPPNRRITTKPEAPAADPDGGVSVVQIVSALGSRFSFS